MTIELNVTIHGKTGIARQAVGIRNAVIAGWTGRDRAAVEKHIVELEELGVPRPTSIPVYYRVSGRRITTSDVLETTGEESSGEVEFVLIRHDGRLLIGVGSDHTDRKVETYNITVSKQMCDKPLAPELWFYEDVKEHWDKLVLRSWAWIGGERVLYQEGAVSGMLSPEELLQGYDGEDGEGIVMFCGTFVAEGGIRPGTRFEYELEDPVLGRSIRHAYDIKVLPVMG